MSCFSPRILSGAGIAVLTFILGSPAHAQTLLHQYSFNGSAADSVGTANGTLLNGATATGGSLFLDGIDDYVQFAQHLVPTSGSYSVTVFARQNASQNGSFVELLSQGFSGGPGFYIGHDTNNGIRASDSWLATGTPFATDTAFHNYALTVNAVAGNSQLYFDGVLRATLNTAITTTTGGSDTRFGRQFGSINENFNGQLRDVRVYSGALSGAQVAAIAAGSVAPEPSALALLAATLPLFGGFAMRRLRK